MGSHGIYRSSVCVEVDDPDAETAREVEIEFEAEMVSDDDGLAVEIKYAWDGHGNQFFSEDQHAEVGLVDLVQEQAYESAYTIGQIPAGRYTRARHRSQPFGVQIGPHSTEVLGVCKVPGQFDWLAICRDVRPPVSLQKDDANGYVLRHVGGFMLACDPRLPDDLDEVGFWVREEDPGE